VDFAVIARASGPVGLISGSCSSGRGLHHASFTPCLTTTPALR
jgi:hypothetical protein